MKKSSFLLILIFVCLNSYSKVEAYTSSPKIAISTNLGETAVFTIGSLSLESSTLIPVLINIDVAGKEKTGFVSTLQYRYHRDGSNLSSNEFAILAGLRFNPSGSGLNNFHLSPKVGMAYVSGRNYFDEEMIRILLIFQPELGYSKCLFDNKIFIDAGVGIQFRYPIIDQPYGVNWNAFGRLIDYWVPQINLNIGFCLPN